MFGLQQSKLAKKYENINVLDHYYTFPLNSNLRNTSSHCAVIDKLTYVSVLLLYLLQAVSKFDIYFHRKEFRRKKGLWEVTRMELAHRTNIF